MKLFFTAIFAFTFTLVSLAQADEIDSSQDKIKVEKAVVHWADSVFYSHSNYKFENFHAEYTDEYFIAVMRSKAYQERVTDLEKDKSGGRYKGTQEEYDKEHQTLQEQAQKAQGEADNFAKRAEYYQVHFWSNIQTTDGITVYYEHIVKLNNNYQVTEAVINSAIGKKDENTKILYKADVKPSGDNKRTENPDNQQIRVQPGSDKSSATSQGDNNTVTTDKNTDSGNSENSTDSKKEKKKKKK